MRLRVRITHFYHVQIAFTIHASKKVKMLVPAQKLISLTEVIAVPSRRNTIWTISHRQCGNLHEMLSDGMG